MASLNATSSNLTTSTTTTEMIRIQTGMLTQIANFAPVIGILIAVAVLLNIMFWAIPSSSDLRIMVEPPLTEAQEPTEREMFDKLVDQHLARIEQPQE
jgi:hypothetical protein